MNKLLALFIISFPLFSIGQNHAFYEIDSIATVHLKKDKIVGLSIGIVKDNEIFYTKGYGTKTIGENLSVDSSTNFLTCSISKLFTATAILQLIEQGKLKLDDKLIDIVPEFKMKDERYKDITVYHLLTHTAGVNNYFRDNFISPKNDSLALTEFALKLKNKKLKFAPGVDLSHKTYSNSGYNLLGLIIERVSGTTFSNYMDENLLHPLGMDKSSFFIDSISENRRSTPHKKGWIFGKIKKSNYYPDIPQDKHCGNLNSCSIDLCKWMLHNLEIYNTKETGLISASTQSTMWTTQEKIKGYSTSIGLGWWIVESKEYGTYLFHVGNDPGFSGTLIISPQNNFGIVVLSNGMYNMNQVWNDIPFEIIDLFKNNWNKQIRLAK